MLTASLIAREGAATTLPDSPVIFTDHLNSVHLLQYPAKSTPHALFTHPARSLYRWILNVRLPASHTSPANPIPIISHVKAHTDSTTISSQMNRLVDAVASQSHRRRSSPAYAVPVPTFTMDEFAPFTPSLGFFEASLHAFIEDGLARLQAPPPNPVVPSYSLYDKHPPPEYHYTRAQSSRFYNPDPN